MQVYLKTVHLKKRELIFPMATELGELADFYSISYICFCECDYDIHG